MKWFKRKENPKEKIDKEYLSQHVDDYKPDQLVDYQTQINLLKTKLKSIEEENERIRNKIIKYREMLGYLFHYEAAYHLQKDPRYDLEVLMVNEWDYHLKREELIEKGYKSQNYLYNSRFNNHYNDPLQLGTIHDNCIERCNPIDIYIKIKENNKEPKIEVKKWTQNQKTSF